MRVDAFTHFFPRPIFDRLVELGGAMGGMVTRMREVPAVHDLDARLRIIDSFPDYAQIQSLGMPPLDVLSRGDAALELELARIANDAQAELVARRGDHFPAFIAAVPMLSADAGAAEAERAIRDLGAIGVQVHTNVAGAPLDHPRFAPLFAVLHRLDAPIWLHPARGAGHPDYLTETKSLYEIWWAFGWLYETSAAMARLVFSQTFDRHPGLKVIAHHLGAMAPFAEGRIGSGWDQLGARTSDEDYVALRQRLKKRPIDYFREDFHADSAAFGSRAATLCGLAFYGTERIVFASDCPFDPEGGYGYIRDTIRIIDELDISAAARGAIYCGNLERLTGRSFQK
jgi:aminocarboxymuconate-semialdehyde decarboxylase